MSTLFSIFHSIESSLFPWLEEELDPLSEKEQQFVQVVSLTKGVKIIAVRLTFLNVS